MTAWGSCSSLILHCTVVPGLVLASCRPTTDQKTIWATQHCKQHAGVTCSRTTVSSSIIYLVSTRCQPLLNPSQAWYNTGPELVINMLHSTWCTILSHMSTLKTTPQTAFLARNWNEAALQQPPTPAGASLNLLDYCTENENKRSYLASQMLTQWICGPYHTPFDTPTVLLIHSHHRAHHNDMTAQCDLTCCSK